jgi:hypothetical protein
MQVTGLTTRKTSKGSFDESFSFPRLSSPGTDTFRHAKAALMEGPLLFKLAYIPRALDVVSMRRQIEKSDRKSKKGKRCARGSEEVAR